MTIENTLESIIDKLSDPAEARRAHELQVEFLKKHLSRWVDELTDNIKKNLPHLCIADWQR